MAVGTLSAVRGEEVLRDGASDGGQAGFRRRPGAGFFPLPHGQPLMLEEGVGDHRHQRVAVQPDP